MLQKIKADQVSLPRVNFQILTIVWLLSVLVNPVLSLTFPNFFTGGWFSDIFLDGEGSTIWQVLGNALFIPLLILGLIFLLVFIVNGEILAKKKSWSWILQIAIIISVAVNIFPVVQDLFNF
jgi:hypothetical protein